MTAQPPAHGPPSPRQEEEAIRTLAALDLACHDATLPLATRALLQQVRQTLVAARLEAQAARSRYQALFDAVPDPISILDESGIVLDLNKAGALAYQRSRYDLIGQSITTLNPDLPEDHLRPVWEALNRGESYVLEVSNMRADGSRFPVEVHSANLHYEGRNCIVAVARDLTDRRVAELRYRELMELIDKGIIVRDATGRILHANVAALRLFDGDLIHRAGFSPADDNWLVVDEHGRELAAEDLPPACALREGRPVSSTVLGLFHRTQRSLTWVSVTAAPQFRPGEVHAHEVLSIYSDVTALKRDSALFERAQALAHIGGWEWDTGRDRLYLTSEARRIIGRRDPPDTLERFLQCLIEPDHGRLRLALDQAMATGRSLELELQGVRDDNSRFWMRVIGEAEAGGPLSAHLTGTVQDITDRKRAEEVLRLQARTDPLTGLLNRDAMRMELETRLASPLQPAFALLYIDLDRFKVVNDVLGHAAGDRLLMSAARRIQRAVGDEAAIARFGGDEFLVLCNTFDDPDRPARLADAILAVFGDSFRMDGEEFAITASIGIAHAPADGALPQQLLQNADVAMYDSKRRARNSWQLFTPELAARQQERLNLETHLRRAIDNHEFTLVYQPQVDLVSGRAVAAEALIRWHNGALGDMQPGQFISHAETTGDIIRIGGWALTEACRQLRRWRDAGLAIERMAVNVSYRQFVGGELAEHVRDALAESGLPGSALELEFTERVLIEDDRDTLRTFAALRELGVALSIDDFGEGYSALNYLRRLPIHGLKLSQLFVQGIPGNASDVAICEAVIGIARSLGLGLVAEGVETARQRDFLVARGVSLGQGFLYGPGLAADEFAHLVQGSASPHAFG